MNKSEIRTCRLQKYLAMCGVASRRNSEKIIAEKRVSINDKIVTKQGCKVDLDNDIVKLDGVKLNYHVDNITLMLNKPAGYVCTMNDPQSRPHVAQLVPVDEHPSLFPMGRLDRYTSGMLVFSTDGNLCQNLMHPKAIIHKTYRVVIDNILKKNSKEHAMLENGVKIDSGMTSSAVVNIIEYVNFDKYQLLENEHFKNCSSVQDYKTMPKTKHLLNKTFTVLDISIHEGKNRQIRKMFSALGYEVLLLSRYKIGTLELGSLKIGQWKKLNESDIKKMFTN